MYFSPGMKFGMDPQKRIILAKAFQNYDTLGPFQNKMAEIRVKHLGRHFFVNTCSSPALKSVWGGSGEVVFGPLMI